MCNLWDSGMRYLKLVQFRGGPRGDHGGQLTPLGFNKAGSGVTPIFQICAMLDRYLTSKAVCTAKKTGKNIPPRELYQ